MSNTEVKIPKIKYDELSDTLIITFVSGIKATGISLTDQILFRYDFEHHQPIGLHFMDYSVLTQPTEMGKQNFPMTPLSNFSAAERSELFNVLLSKPVNQFLNLSAYTVSILEKMPIIALTDNSLQAIA